LTISFFPVKIEKMDKIYIKELKDPASQGREIISCFALRKMELRTKDSDGKPFLSLELGDASGRMDAVLWNEAQAAFSQLAVGDAVAVKATVGSYRDSPQLRVENIAKADPSDYSLEHFLPQSSLSPAEREAAIRSELVGIKDPVLAKLLSLFFDDGDFRQRFLAAPAAKLWHHAYLGGLAEHTLAVCRLAHAAAANYELLDHQLLLTGALLHDIGKIPEFRVTTFIDYSDEGRLLGHIVLGDQMLKERLAKVRDFPQEKAMRLRHMMLSHHGERERGSPVTPATLEALVLHHCDYLDSHAGAFTRIIKREGGSGKRWSDYVNLIDRFIYLPEGNGESEEPRLL